MGKQSARNRTQTGQGYAFGPGAPERRRAGTRGVAQSESRPWALIRAIGSLLGRPVARDVRAASNRTLGRLLLRAFGDPGGAREQPPAVRVVQEGAARVPEHATVPPFGRQEAGCPLGSVRFGMPSLCRGQAVARRGAGSGRECSERAPGWAHRVVVRAAAAGLHTRHLSAHSSTHRAAVDRHRSSLVAGRQSGEICDQTGGKPVNVCKSSIL